jgi:hypothetical protein
MKASSTFGVGAKALGVFDIFFTLFCGGAVIHPIIDISELSSLTNHTQYWTSILTSHEVISQISGLSALGLAEK